MNHSAKLFATCLLASFFGVIGCESPDTLTAAPPASKPAQPPLRVELTTDKTTYHVGEKLRGQVRIVNQSDRTLWLVGSLDGSNSGMRFPKLTATRTAPPEFEAQVFGRCGNTNNLRNEDFVKVDPGESFNPYHEYDGHFVHANTILGGAFTVPGEYVFQLTYDISSDDPGEWWGLMGPGEPSRWMRQKIKNMPHVVVTSEPLKITVLPAEAS